MTPDVITVGRVNMDLFSQQIGADFEDIRGFDAMVGGSPTNVAIGTARLGLSSMAFTGVGEDRVGDFVLRYLSDEHVDVSHVQRIRGKSTSLALLGIKPPNDFPLTFYRDDPADIHLTTEQAAALPLRETKAILLSGNALSRGTCADATKWLAQRAAELHVESFLDLDLRPVDWADPLDYGRAMRELMLLCDTVVGTQEEFFAALAPDPGTAMAGGLLSDEQCAQLPASLDALVAQHRPTTLILKRGAAGATVKTRDDEELVPGFEVDVLNTVGAGDAFASGLIARRLAGEDWHQAVRFANACGAIVVTRHGCSVALPREAEVLDFAATHGGL